MGKIWVPKFSLCASFHLHFPNMLHLGGQSLFHMLSYASARPLNTKRVLPRQGRKLSYGFPVAIATIFYCRYRLIDCEQDLQCSI